MTVQYNVNIVGNLVNSSGVLSGFSSSDYATITTPITFGTTWEINTKIHTGNDVSGLQIILCPDIDQEGVRIEFTNGVWGLLCGYNGTWINTNDYQGGTVSANTTYWLKAMYNGAGNYSLKVSTDGITYTTAVSYWGGNDVTSNFTSYIIGIYSDFSQGIYGGSIDLTKSNIISDGLYIWQGVLNSTVGTKIQLRHDTAANWTSVNPVLLEGEVGIETDTRKQKFGDGSTAWNSLPYDVGSTALQSITSSDVTIALGYTPVNKAGDTMSGSLTINNNSLFIKHPIARDGSNPSSGSWKAINFTDSSSPQKRFALIESSVQTNGSSTLGLYAYKNQSADSNNSFLMGWDNSGNKYAELNSKLLVGGVLTIGGNATQQVIKNNINYSTYTTSGETYSDLQFQNYAGNRFNTIRSAITYDNTGTANGSYMILGSNKLNSSAPDGIKIKCNSSNVITTEAPACEDNNSIVTTVSKNKAQNGYYKLGNGLIVQWGTNSVTYSSNTINLPTAFTSTNYIALAIPAHITNGYGVTGRATTSFTFNATATTTIDWIAIGY